MDSGASPLTVVSPPAFAGDGASSSRGNSPPVPTAIELAGRALQQRMRPCEPAEMLFAEVFVQTRRKIAAFKVAYPYAGLTNAAHYARASEVSARPWVLQYIRELQSAAAASCVIDAAALLDADRRIVEAADHLNDLIRYEWQCCRYCHGEGHAWQWIDANEFVVALAAAFDANAEREARKLPLAALPSDDGGYGFAPTAEPNILCPKCEGRGVRQTIIADTRNLPAHVAPLYKGVKETKNGLEVMLHDVDKAKDRLLRAAGVFKDDAASVARGAAAGAAAGASAAAAMRGAQAVQSMTVEQAQRLYLELAQ